METQGLLRGDGSKQPDGLNIILRQNLVDRGDSFSGCRGKQAYQVSRSLGCGVHFYHVVIETLGAWGKDAQGLVSELGGRLTALTENPRSLAFLRQHFGIAMQRGNASAIHGTLRELIACFYISFILHSDILQLICAFVVLLIN